MGYRDDNRRGDDDRYKRSSPRTIRADYYLRGHFIGRTEGVTPVVGKTFTLDNISYKIQDVCWTSSDAAGCRVLESILS